MKIIILYTTYINLNFYYKLEFENLKCKIILR